MNRLSLAAILAVTASGIAAFGGLAPVAAAPVPFPEPPREMAQPHGNAVAVVAGGCFWGMEGVYEHVKGVKSVTAGYAGGTAATANYGDVSSETTGHAEAVRITYDPAVVSYGQLLKVFFAVAHDPTQVEGQYPDSGHSYRSAIFAQTPAQRAEAVTYIAALGAAHTFSRPIATRLENGQFYPAEAYHQGYLRHNPNAAYIAHFDMPKLAALHDRLPELWHS